MAEPTPAQIEQLFAIHNGAERRAENLLRSYGFDSTRSWVDPAGHRLSDRVWRARQEVRNQIDRVLRDAIANGTDALEVADVLEQYLNPSLSPVRDQLGRLIRDQQAGIVTRAPGRSGMGSFSARRLARTEITRAYSMATFLAAQANPFVAALRWALSNRHPRADECSDKAERDVGLGPGVYPVGDAPIPPSHPQCLCRIEPVTTNNVDGVIADLKAAYDL